MGAYLDKALPSIRARPAWAGAMIPRRCCCSGGSGWRSRPSPKPRRSSTRSPPDAAPVSMPWSARLEGMLLYRQWMIAAHRRTKSGVVTVATGQAAELELLGKAIATFEAADAKEPTSAGTLVAWGNVVRAAGKYEEAAALYRRSADLTGAAMRLSTSSLPILIQVVAGPQPADQGTAAEGARRPVGLSGLDVGRRAVRSDHPQDEAGPGATRAMRTKCRPSRRA